MKKVNNQSVGKLIHVGKPFKSIDGVYLNKRFMCIFAIEDEHLLLMPMSTFHNEIEKSKKLLSRNNFEYSKIHGNTRDGYIKCNQIYFLTKEEFNNFNEIRFSRRIEDKHFEKLQHHVETLNQENKIKFLKRKMVFKDPDGLIKREQVIENDYEYE